MEPRLSYKRVYAGCKYIDQVEQICIDLAKQLFNVDFADVRPISGVCANLVAYTTFTTPEDTIRRGQETDPSNARRLSPPLPTPRQTTRRHVPRIRHQNLF